MPLFQYEAVSDRGKKFSATIDADHIQDAKLKLVRRQVAVLNIQPLKQQALKNLLSKADLLNLTREISRLLQAGIPLYETLAALEEKYQGQKPHRLLQGLCDSIKSGLSFSESLSKFPQTFDLLYTSMVANAEKTGSLSHALNDLAEFLSRGQKVRKQLMAALLYPAMLCGFCLVVLSSLLFYVIPSLKELFDGRDLHPFTLIVFAVSQFACNAKGILAVLFLGSIGSAVSIFFFPAWKKRVVSTFLRLPFLKSLFAKVAFVRFCRACATLLEGGLPLIQAFSQARLVMRHVQLERVIAIAEEKISQGESIHVAFKHSPLIPPLVSRMIAIAENGGNLPFMMGQIAQIYEEELEKTLTHFATVAQPILLLILGAIIGFVLLSVLLPLTDVSSFATN